MTSLADLPALPGAVDIPRLTGTELLSRETMPESVWRALTVLCGGREPRITVTYGRTWDGSQYAFSFAGWRPETIGLSVAPTFDEARAQAIVTVRRMLKAFVREAQNALADLDA